MIQDRALTILCVDDDPAIPKIYERRLKPYRWRVLSACSGQEGYRRALETTPDLILLDYILPDENGIQFLSRLKAKPEIAQIPVLMLTGSDTPAIRRQIFSLGASGLLEKPVDFGEMIDEIRNLFPLDLSLDSHAAPDR
jgi:DNA-binding response OmpR family regulator